MGHMMRGIIGKQAVIETIAGDWCAAQLTELPQGYAMVLLTDALFDGITELYDAPNQLDCTVLTFYTTAIAYFLQYYSFHTKLIYIETDYFGGHGSQAGVLVADGKVCIGPVSGSGAINRLLRAIGVWTVPGKTPFEMLELEKYRRM